MHKETEKIQLGAGVAFLNFGEMGEQKLAPSRGGGEITVTQTIHDIEFDQRKGKTKGMQVLDSQDVMGKITLLNFSQDNLKMAIINCAELGSGKIGFGELGLIDSEKYLKNFTYFTKTADGKYKKYTILNPMSEKGLAISGKPKAEGELALELYGHHEYEGSDIESIFTIEEVDKIETNNQTGGTEE